MPSSDVDTDAVRVRALSASWGDMMLCGLWWAWPSSLNGGDGEPELQEAEELLPGLEHLSAIAGVKWIELISLYVGVIEKGVWQGRKRRMTYSHADSAASSMTESRRHGMFPDSCRSPGDRWADVSGNCKKK